MDLQALGQKFIEIANQAADALVAVVTGIFVVLLIFYLAMAFFRASNPNAVNQCKETIIRLAVIYIFIANAITIAKFFTENAKA